MICTLPILMLSVVRAQPPEEVVKYFSGDVRLPIVVYLSGDGGFNHFSSKLCESFNKIGYEVIAVDSRKYFWSRKTPRVAAGFLSSLIERQIKGRASQLFILIGYSFGADVTPFIMNEFPQPLQKMMAGAVLISPSETTDFEVHLTDFMGMNSKQTRPVINGINQMHSSKTLILFGSEETILPSEKIKLKNCKTEILAGGHHYKGLTDRVAAIIVNYFHETY